MPGIDQVLYLVSVWALPLIVAITFHEAAHAYVAWRLGDDTAFRLGRVTFNPVRHIDPVGTVLLPGAMLLASASVGAPFVFGYAKPVPIAVGRLRNPRWGMVAVAAAGPATNLLLALASALLIHLVVYLPRTGALWAVENLSNSILINLVLAVFNMLPLPPLDGGRIAVGLLPFRLAMPLARLERYGLLIIVALLFLLPLAGRQIGVDFTWLGRFIMAAVAELMGLLAMLSGHA